MGIVQELRRFPVPGSEGVAVEAEGAELVSLPVVDGTLFLGDPLDYGLPCLDRIEVKLRDNFTMDQDVGELMREEVTVVIGA